MAEGGRDKTDEERMRSGRATLELRMELAGDEVRVLRQLHDLHQLAVGRRASHLQASRLDRLLLLRAVRKLVAVAMPLRYRYHAIFA